MPKTTRKQTTSSRAKLADSCAQMVENLQKLGQVGPTTNIAASLILNQCIADLQDGLNTIGDDAQRANIDLQDVLQKQQQTLQMMSNISKMLSDTAMSVIRKTGG